MSNHLTKRIEHPLISLTTYLRTRRLRVIGGLAVFIVALTVFTSLSVRANDPEATSTTTLEPGDNFIGWVSEPIAVDQVFAAIPEAALIYTWDADRRGWRSAIRGVGGSLETLEPGMAAMIRISGTRSALWERPLTPAKGMVTLYRGVNWVTWVGRDDWPLDQVARGIGQSLVSVRVGDVTYPAPLDSSVGELPALRRGDALQVTVSRDLRWLQPTGMMPTVVWAGDVPQSLQDKITADIRYIIELFAEQFGVESDFSETTILLYQNIEDTIAHEASGAEPQTGRGVDGLRHWLTHRSNSSVYPWGIHMITCAWETPRPQPCWPRAIDTLIHEWLHVLQYQYGAVTAQGPQVSPAWMREGQAMWVQWLLPADLQNVPYEIDRARRVADVARTSVSLQSLEQHSHMWACFHGPLAGERLAEIAGATAHIEYMRRFQPQIIGKERRWVQTPTWHEAFVAAFGITPAAFYEDFAAWRATLPEPQQRYDYDPDDVTLTGTVHHHDGTPAAGYRLNAVQYIDGLPAAIERGTVVDEDGTFSIGLAPQTLQRIWLARDGCTLWVIDDGRTTTVRELSERRLLDTRNLPRLNLMIPAGVCGEANGIEVEVLRLRGDDRSVAVGVRSESGFTWGNRTGSALSLPTSGSGAHQIMFRVGGCDLWYAPGGLVASREEAHPIELSDAIKSLDVRIPHDLCVRQISGRLIRADGAPVPRVWLTASGDRMSGGTYQGANGEFTITVPDSGFYQLSFGVDGCRIRYSSSGATTDRRQATRISVEDEDVTGIEFVVPADPASLCN